MPGVATTGSPNIAILDSRIFADLCIGKFYVDATPSIYIGGGAATVLGANVQITNPFGVIVKPYGANYEIAPALSGGMSAVIPFNIPTQGGNYQYGSYKIDVKLFDSTGSWVVTKTVSICAPDKNSNTRSYGSLSAKLTANCKSGKLYFVVDGVPTYNGVISNSQVNSFAITYPTSSGLPVLNTVIGNLSLVLFEGVYKVNGTICAQYTYGDNVFVKVNYKVKKEKNIRCALDECCVLSKLVQLNGLLKTNCTLAEQQETSDKIFDTLRLLKTAQLQADCGEDPSDTIVDLETLLGCSCTCNCNEGVPIIGSTPAGDFVITGCNTTKTVVGPTTTYVIDNYEYVIAVTNNGGALVVSAPVLNGCTKTQTVTFDIANAYSQIKTLANQNNTEADFWASVVKKALRSDFTCLGLTQSQINALTLDGLFKTLVDFTCKCCGCNAVVTNEVVSTSGNDVRISWSTTAYLTLVYLDGVLMGSYLQGAAIGATFSHVFENAADGKEHTWILRPFCNDKAPGTQLTGKFQYLSCPSIAPPDASNPVSPVCPFDLTSTSAPAPVGLTLEYHNANNTNGSSLVPNPTRVSDGIYYVFYKNVDGCYSIGTKITIICKKDESCTAPQNISVIRFVTCPAFVTFQSAAYPPASYLVKRKAAADPDVDGSYTTIGVPVWNSGLNRWVICDNTAIQNTLYTYKAISICSNSPITYPSISVNYADMSCGGIVATPGVDRISYSFGFTASQINKYEIKIYDATGTTLIHTNTHISPFTSPLTGTFYYLDAGTSYKIVVTAWIGSFSKTTCSTLNTATLPAP